MSNLNEYIIWLVSIAKRCTYLFDEGKSAVVRTNWALRKTLEKLNVDEKKILNCTEDEFLKWVETDELPSPNLLKERDKYFALYIWDDTFKELSTKEEVEKLIKQEGITEFEPISEEITKIEGQVANPGFARGKVVVTYSQEDAEKVKGGDILVASMTTPELIGGMRKAAAFITDEGGITCHAAIISREMNKPCIIGTKIATKVFKDGDLVEVDAEKGIVRILGRK